MAHSAVETQKVSSFKTTDRGINGSISAEYNLTSLSLFQACLLAVAFALPIWASIGYLLTR